MSIEKSQERLSHEPKSLKECATDAIGNIQSLKNGVDLNIDETFPRMAELMNTSDGHKTFQRISDMAQICQWQNGAVDRKAMSKMCEVIDQDATPFSV